MFIVGCMRLSIILINTNKKKKSIFLTAITQINMKHMLVYSFIGQVGYVIIGVIVGDSNGGYASMITYMLFYISMNLFLIWIYPIKD